jgi:hypothetical protein
MKEQTTSHATPWTCRGDNVHWHEIYGIRLCSDIQLAFPDSESMQSADVSLLAASANFFREAICFTIVRPSPTGWYKYAQLDNGQSYLRWDDLFEFLVDADGRRIWWGWLGAPSLESLQVYLLGHALSFALIKQGYEPIHATSVVINGNAVAFIGASGFGKSSLAAAFIADGHPLLTDDMLLLKRTDRGYEAQPGPRRIKLFPEMARRFLMGIDNAVAMNSETEKLVLPLSADYCYSNSVPLRALYVLSPSRAVSRKQPIQLSPLGARETFITLVRATFNPLITGSQRLERQYTECLGVASSVPARRVSYPRVLSLLPVLRQVIVSDLTEIVRADINSIPIRLASGQST